ncbi:molybdopterin containing oxidoreductase [Candidatus Poribacteria bacterium]|nr:MAG: molybdopterin containing oxidoreductase [Candidatus Poribacteria bacterium]
MRKTGHKPPFTTWLETAPDVTRRDFLAKVGRTGLLASLGIFGAGCQAVDQGLLDRGLTPIVLEDPQAAGLPKPDMLVHSEQPFNGEFAPHLLNDDVTPTERHFVRNNSGVPERAVNKNLHGWKLVIDGEVHKKLALSMDDLERFPQVTMEVVLECAGNGRSLFVPEVSGTPWQRGAVACSEWTGVRLRDVLQAAGLKPSAVYTGNYGEDFPNDGSEPFSRGIPIEKAMDEHTLIALKMNGEVLPAAHGFPARLIVPGWIGSAMQKWLNRIWVRDKVHDSEKMSGYSYRIPAYPIAPGDKPPVEDMRIATAWQVKSLITQPQASLEFNVGDAIKIRGHAWAGENRIDKVLISTDFGLQWQETQLTQPSNRYAWSHWKTEFALANRGYYEIWARAYDDTGAAQPFSQPWNPQGYLGNVIHRIPVSVVA